MWGAEVAYSLCPSLPGPDCLPACIISKLTYVPFTQMAPAHSTKIDR